MKHSKLFLGLTPCLLGAAGIVTAKRFDSSRIRFYCTVGHAGKQYCKSCGASTYTLSANVLDPLATCPFMLGPIAYHATLYTSGIAGALCGGNNCQTPLYYSDTN